MESVFSIQSVEDLVSYMQVAELLKNLPLELKVTGKSAAGAVEISFVCHNLKGEVVPLPEGTKATIVELPNVAVVLQKTEKGYTAKFTPAQKRAFVTLRVEYLPKASIEEKVILPGKLEFTKLKYRTRTGISGDFSTMSYPSQMESLKVTEQYKVDFNLEYDESGIVPNNTFIILKHKTYPTIKAIVHLDPVKKQVTIDFSNSEIIKNINGEYEVTIKAQSQNVENEWYLGSIIVELSSGTGDYIAPPVKGPLKKKEAGHTFPPELKYAPAFISIPVAASVLVLVLIFVYYMAKIGVALNNWPATVAGKIHAILFVLAFIALFALYGYFWFRMKFLELLPILGIFCNNLIVNSCNQNSFGHHLLRKSNTREH